MKPDSVRPQGMNVVAHMTCNMCGEKVTVTNPVEANIWIKSHLEAVHPGKAAEMAAIDRKIGALNQARDRLIAKFNQKLEACFTGEQGRIMTVPASFKIKPS